MTSYRNVFNTLITIPAFDPLSVAYAPVYLPIGRRPVSFRAQSARVPAHRPQAGFFSGAKRPCTCPPVAGLFPFGREAPVYLPTGHRPVSFQARSACVPAHRPQASFFSGAKRPCTCPPAAGLFLFGRKAPCTCPPAAGLFPFGREAPVYLPTGRRLVSFRALIC